MHAHCTGCPKKYIMLLEPWCTDSITSQWLAPLGPRSVFGGFLLLVKTKLMSMVKFSPTALNFGYDLVLLVHFFWAGQGGRSWQPFGECKNCRKIFVLTIFAFFATNSSFLRVIANLQI